MSAQFSAELVLLLPRLRRFARSLDADPERADDLVQEACAKALSRQRQWKRGSRLDSWMYRIIQNTWLDGLRRQQRWQCNPIEDWEQAEPGEGWEGQVEAQLDLQQVLAAMSGLSPDARVVIALVCVEGLSYQAAAEVLELPIGTVMSRLSRARRNLFTLLAEGSDAKSH